ncbi:MAG: CCA tRNA nucleotidyltransferase [Lachnospiraceae bacterium]|nr:CCA tRNA nucleotidyltransferase [Lachnospiraceae bacterium]
MQNEITAQKILLPEAVKMILTTLSDAGYEGYAVGGCIRDSLLGRKPSDWDITTSATPGQVKELFRHTIDTGIEHGTVTVMLDHVGYEVTTYRIDGEYEDGRHPKQVTFTPSLFEDLRRRDFTVNAMAYNEKEGLVDLFGGIEDMKNGLIRAVGDPMERFSEDALRMMRAVRFSAQLGYRIHEETQEAIQKLSKTLAKVSAERIRVELEKLLVSPHPEQFILCYKLGLTEVFLPEFHTAMITTQNNPHHCYDVGEHIMESIKAVRADKVLRFTMLFHDLGKPACKTTDEEGIDHFKGHPAVSAKIADERMRALRFDNETRKRIIILTENHDLRISPEKKAIRKVLSRLGEDNLRLLWEVQIADTTAQSDYQREEKLAGIAEAKRQMELVLADKECFSIKDLAVNGQDLLQLGYPKGPALGAELKELLAAVLEDPSQNTKETLLKLAAEQKENL